MKIGVKVWQSGKEFSIGVYFLLLSLYIAHILPLLFLSYGAFYSKY